MANRLEVIERTVVAQMQNRGIVLQRGGWSPVWGFVKRASDGAQVVQIAGWFGGTGPLPQENRQRTGWFIGSGDPPEYVEDVAEAVPLAIVERVGSGTVTRDHLSPDIVRLLTKAPEELDADGLDVRLILDNGTVLNATLSVGRADIAAAAGAGGLAHLPTFANNILHFTGFNRDDGDQSLAVPLVGHDPGALTTLDTMSTLTLADYSTDDTDTELVWGELDGDHVAQGITKVGNTYRFANKGTYTFKASLHARAVGGTGGGDRTIIDLFAKSGSTEIDYTRDSMYHRGARTGITDVYDYKLLDELDLEAGDEVTYFLHPDFEGSGQTLSVTSSVVHITSGAVVPITPPARSVSQLTTVFGSLVGNLRGFAFNTVTNVLSRVANWLSPADLDADTPAKKKAFRDLLDVKDPISAPDEVSYLSPSESLNDKVVEALLINDDAGAAFTGLDGFGRFLLFVKPTSSGAPIKYSLSQYAASLDKPGLYAQRELLGQDAAISAITTDWRPHHIRAQLPATADLPNGAAAPVTVEALQDLPQHRTEAPLSMVLEPDADGEFIDNLNTQGFIQLRTYQTADATYQRNRLYLTVRDSVFPQDADGDATISVPITLKLRQQGVSNPGVESIDMTSLLAGGGQTTFQSGIMAAQIQGRFDGWLEFTNTGVTPHEQRFAPETFQPENITLTRFTAMVRNGALVAGLTEAEVNNLLAAYSLPYTQSEQRKLGGIEAGAQVNEPQTRVDWNATQGVASIANQPDLNTYAKHSEVVLPAYRRLANNESDLRFQVMLHSGGAREDVEVVFPAWENDEREVPPGQSRPQFNNQASVSAILPDGDSRVTFFPPDYYQAALRGRFRVSPRDNFIRDFAPTRQEVSASVDRAVTQSQVLTASSGGTLLSTPVSAALRIPNAGASRWWNFLNASNNYRWTTDESQQPRYAESEQLGRVIAARNQPNLESRARPSSGWPASTVYSQLGAQPIPVRVTGALDDDLLLRVGFTSTGAYAIPQGRHGGRAWSDWHRAVDLKSWTKLASPYNRGTEVYPERYLNEENADFRVSPNAIVVRAHEVLVLQARIDNDGYFRFWSDEWGRLGSVLIETSYLPWP